MPVEEFLVILKKVPLKKRHLLSNNWVLLERGNRRNHRLYTIYNDKKRPDGQIYLIDFYHDEHAVIYFDYHKWTAKDLGYLFQLFIDENNKK